MNHTTQPSRPNPMVGLQQIQQACQDIDYRVSGDHSTWDAYHEGQHDLAATIEDILDSVQATTTVLSFIDVLLLMEAVDRLADDLRAQVANGDTSVQADLERTDHLSHMLTNAASIELTQPAATTPSGTHNLSKEAS
ncbi:hypothetical protein [Actinomyces oricola]|uniref:hypothetical protein n=1 Tax=Actinomyces oricola TaxID=206043 RepID=UPI000FFEE8BC|nr:hypothetical protein [Actinomyces oricola]